MKLKQTNCFICKRIELINNNQNPYFISEGVSGYLVLRDSQGFQGSCIFLYNKHKENIEDLEDRSQLMQEVFQSVQAIKRAFKPERVNIEILGNKDPHVHIHLFPRYADDPDPKAPVWVGDNGVRLGATKTDISTIVELKKKLLKHL